MAEPEREYSRGPRSLDDSASAHANERAWTDRIRVGDSAAFEGLFRAYWQPLYAFAFRYVQSKDEAEEVVQHVFFRIWRRRAEWRPTTSVRSYLFGAVRNAALDRLKRAANAHRWRDRQVNELANAPALSAGEIEAHLESAELMAAVEQALAELPARRRAACTLRLIDGLSYAQIADRLGITEKTVETQIARGLKFLRERFRDVFCSALSITAATLLRIVS